MGWLKYEGRRDACVYALVDPCTLERRYVGKTVNDPEGRRKGHVRETRRKPSTSVNYRRAWIRQLLDRGLEPQLLILERGLWLCDELNEREVRWIEKLRDEGSRLTNATAGGDGGFNAGLLAYNTRTWTDEERARHSERMKSWAKEHKARGGSFRGSDESDQKRQEARKRWHDNGGRQVMSERLTTAWADDNKRSNFMAGIRRAGRKKSEATKRRYLDPDERQRTAAAVRRSWDGRRGPKSG